jgi:hypothetical protein
LLRIFETQVMPERAVRQWVLTLPIRLRFRCALEKGFVGKVLTIWHEELRKFQTKRGWLAHSQHGETGLVTVIQRFGSDLRLNIHFHTLIIEGVYAEDGSGGLTFCPLPAPSNEDVLDVLTRVVKRIEKMTRRSESGPELSPEAAEGRHFGGPQVWSSVQGAGGTDRAVGRRQVLGTGGRVHDTRQHRLRLADRRCTRTSR